MDSAKSARGDRSKSPLGGTFKAKRDQSKSPGPGGDMNFQRQRAATALKRAAPENNSEYENFLKLVGNTPGIRSKRMNAAVLIATLEDIYTARFLKDTSYFKAQLKKGTGEEISDKSFSDFIVNYYKKKHKNNKINVQQGCQDLVCSLEFHRKDMTEADLFANFLTQKYDTRDLVFYLYTRCLLEKELGIKFSTYGKVSPVKTVDPRTLNLTMKTCRKIASIFFEEDENELSNFLNSVQEKIDEHAEVTGEKRIQATVFLMLLLDEFHVSKNSTSMQKSLGIMDNPFEDDVTNEDQKFEEPTNGHEESHQGT